VFLLGRNRQCIDYAVVQNTDPFLEGIGADWLRVRAARPERLEPVSPLSSRLGAGIDWLAVSNLQLGFRAFGEKLASGQGRTFVAGAFDRNRKPFAIHAAE
jgi:hypothetical protein